MALDRPDLSFCAKELSRGMASPTTMDVVRLKRALRYLKGCPAKVILFRWQISPRALSACVTATGLDARAPADLLQGGH